MNKQERHNQILTRIAAGRPDEKVRTSELANELNVSNVTIRRDLQELSDSGAIVRTYGGVKIPRPTFNSMEPIGILLGFNYGKFSNPFFNELLEGADNALHHLGYHPVFVKNTTEVETQEQIEHLIQQHRIKGLLIIGKLSKQKHQLWRSLNPITVNLAGLIDEETDAVLVSGFNGMQEMVRHLASRGHDRVGFIMRHDHGIHNNERLRGYLKGVKELQLDDDPELVVKVVYEGVTKPAQIGKEGAQRLLSLKKPPTAIMCISDVIALGAMQWLQIEGYSIPEDVAITGFDNIEGANLVYPPLTTVHVHKSYLGRLAVEQLHRRIEHPDDPPIRIFTPTSLVIRLSS
jgi:DNA-binding LacI/PurR family transcriptional regulator